MPRFSPLPLIAAAAVALATGNAVAHAHLASATPAPNSVVAPTRTVSLTFSGRIVSTFSDFDVVDAAGAKAELRIAHGEDGKSMTATLARPLTAGTHRVNWRIASSDGHRMTGSYSFTVR
ncbi:MAG TPA: copper homeostasis periplasmic binding protein CopC [Brevundimonas sp.]|jgi:methionine-rich copper-binding protein CopC|uniref:copper homeostasis periplasmic binding protein CopC n=1 Tax=Brevundimonas sp. TaxID=1871086 RepID=UPI002DF605B5|nr:copper homeostasis periplasmic binding protein CopC [Brevundimonas sp.]